MADGNPNDPTSAGWARYRALQPPSVDAPATTIKRVVRDGQTWPLATPADVHWITAGTAVGTTITAAVPALFGDYATVLLPRGGEDQSRHDDAIVSVLRAQSPEQPWWLGYLDTGADDVVFPDAPRVALYSDWRYVLIRAGPEQAATWRRPAPGSFWMGQLPNLIFPVDHSWLASTLWDDEWTCFGGPGTLVEGLLCHPQLRPRARRVALGEDATPPGHEAI